MTIAQSAIFYCMLGAFAFLLIGYTLHFVQLIRMAFSLRKYEKNERYADHGRFIKSENTIPVSIFLPAYNEAQNILDTVRNLLSLNFPEYEVIVINDGSTDNTLLLLKLEYELVALQQPYKRSIKTSQVNAIYRSPLHSNLIVVDKAHGGKADSLNTAINISNYPVFVTVETNSILERDSLVKIIMPFVNDFRVIGLNAMVRVSHGWRLEHGQPRDMGLAKNNLIVLQTVEYLRTFLTGRIGSDTLGMVKILSGSFGAFSKGAAIDVGGFTNECISEDMDLTIRLHRRMLEQGRPYAIKFIASPVCWTKSPTTYKELIHQRQHWHCKLTDSLLHNKDMLFNKKFGKLGMLSMPYYWLFELISPAVETFAYAMLVVAWLTGAVGWLFALSTFMMVALYGTILSMGALLLEERSIERYDTANEMLRLVLFSFLDNLGYRQINAMMCAVSMLGFSKQRRALKGRREKEFRHTI